MGTEKGKIEVKDGTETFKFIFVLPWTIDKKYQGKLIGKSKEIVEVFNEETDFSKHF